MGAAHPPNSLQQKPLKLFLSLLSIFLVEMHLMCEEVSEQ